MEFWFIWGAVVLLFLVWGFTFDELMFFGLLWSILAVPSWWAIRVIMVIVAGILQGCLMFFFLLSHLLTLSYKTLLTPGWGFFNLLGLTNRTVIGGF